MLYVHSYPFHSRCSSQLSSSVLPKLSGVIHCSAAILDIGVECPALFRSCFWRRRSTGRLISLPTYHITTSLSPFLPPLSFSLPLPFTSQDTYTFSTFIHLHFREQAISGPTALEHVAERQRRWTEVRLRSLQTLRGRERTCTRNLPIPCIRSRDYPSCSPPPLPRARSGIRHGRRFPSERHIILHPYEPYEASQVHSAHWGP